MTARAKLHKKVNRESQAPRSYANPARESREQGKNETPTKYYSGFTKGEKIITRPKTDSEKPKLHPKVGSLQPPKKS